MAQPKEYIVTAETARGWANAVHRTVDLKHTMKLIAAAAQKGRYEIIGSTLAIGAEASADNQAAKRLRELGYKVERGPVDPRDGSVCWKVSWDTASRTVGGGVPGASSF